MSNCLSASALSILKFAGRRTMLKIKNDEDTSTEVISEQLKEYRPLPMGRTEFEEWSDRLIAGAVVGADVPSQKYALANLLLHLGPTEDHKPDIFFIKSLRKFAVNQVADAIRQELYAARKAVGDSEAKTTEG